MSDGSLRLPMKLLFVILAHDRPAEAAELARTLVEAGSDARALIHFDARAPEPTFTALAAAVAGEPRIGLIAERVACRWGGFGLVEAPLLALAEAEAKGLAPDYVILLSGACLPCRPVASLERYLAENAGREFIESEDESWITGGWRSERWRFWHLFDHKTQNLAEMVSARVQAALRVRRRFPAGLEPRFGSQWWALTWPACLAVLADTRRNPKRLDFFRTVWIPDEMVFQTYVRALVPEGAITGFNLTHYQFTNRGKPIVFHEDHAPYVETLDRFFFRKISPEARALRATCLARARDPDDGADLGRIGARQDHYALKLRAQTHHNPPGALFYRDQFVDQVEPVLTSTEAPYVVLLGPPARARALAARLPEPPFTVLGEVFAPGAVDFGPGRAELGGLRRTDTAIRDQHPALFLTRVRARAKEMAGELEGGGVPVILWSPADQRRLIAAVLRDPAALVVTLPPRSGDPGRDRDALLRESLGPRRLRDTGLPLGMPPGRLRAAAVETGSPEQPDIPGWLVSGVAPREAPDLRAPDLALPWGGDLGPATRERRRTELGRQLAICRFRDAAWFPALAAALAAAGAPEAVPATLPEPAPAEPAPAEPAPAEPAPPEPEPAPAALPEPVR